MASEDEPPPSIDAYLMPEEEQQEGVDGNDDLRLPIQEVSCCNTCRMFVESLHSTMFVLFAMQTVNANKVHCLVTAKGLWLTGISHDGNAGASFTASAQQNHKTGADTRDTPPPALSANPPGQPLPDDDKERDKEEKPSEDEHVAKPPNMASAEPPGSKSSDTSHARLPPDKGGPKVSHAPRPMQYASHPLSLPSHCTSLEGTGSRGCIIVAHPLLVLKVRERMVTARIDSSVAETPRQSANQV